MVIWAGTMPLGRWMVSESLGDTIPPLIIVIIRFTIAVIVLLLIMRWKEHSIDISFARTYWKQLSVLGFLIIGIYQTGFMFGEFFTSASDVSLVIASSPIWLLIIARLILKESVTAKKLIGMVMGFVGVIIIISFSPNVNVPDRILGNAFALMASLATAVYTLRLRHFNKKVKGERGTAPSSLKIITWSLFFGLILTAPISLLLHPEYLALNAYLTIPIRIWGGIFYLAFFATIFGLMGYIEGVKRLSPDRAIIFLNIVPILGVLLSVILLNEIFDPLIHSLSLGLIVIGLTLVNRQFKPKNQRLVEVAQKIPKHPYPISALKKSLPRVKN